MAGLDYVIVSFVVDSLVDWDVVEIEPKQRAKGPKVPSMACFSIMVIYSVISMIHRGGRRRRDIYSGKFWLVVVSLTSRFDWDR